MYYGDGFAVLWGAAPTSRTAWGFTHGINWAQRAEQWGLRTEPWSLHSGAQVEEWKPVALLVPIRRPLAK